MGCHMSLKMHFFHLHLKFFPRNLGAVSDEQGKIFDQSFQAIKERYQGLWNEGMISDFCWMLYGDDRTHAFKRNPMPNILKSSSWNGY